MRASVGLREIEEFREAHDTWPRGDRPAAIRESATRFRGRFLEEGEVRAVRTVDLVSAAYPASFAFHGAARGINPYVNILNRLVVVQFDDFAGGADAGVGADGSRGLGRGALLRATDPEVRRVPRTASATVQHDRLGARRRRHHPRGRRLRVLRPPPRAGPAHHDGHDRAGRRRERAARAVLPQREVRLPGQGGRHVRVDPPDAVGLVRPGRHGRRAHRQPRARRRRRPAREGSRAAVDARPHRRQPLAVRQHARRHLGQLGERGGRRQLAPAPVEDPRRAQVRRVLRTARS